MKNKNYSNKRANEVRWQAQREWVANEVNTKRCETCGGDLIWTGKINTTTVRKRRFCRECLTQQVKDRQKIKRKEKSLTSNGYVLIWDGDQRKLEHVAVMERRLGRPLESNEIVFHWDGDKTNNNFSNLLLCDRSFANWLFAEMGRKHMREKFGPSVPDEEIPGRYLHKGYWQMTVGSRTVGVHVHKAEAVLGRKLKANEVVHHINGDTLDNRNCNLLICTKSYHNRLHNEMSRQYQKDKFRLDQ